jgi:MFS family permease
MQRRPRSDDPELENVKPSVNGNGNRIGGRPPTVADEPPDRGKGPPTPASTGGRGSGGGLIGGTFASLQYRDFTFLWLGQITHAFALWIDQLAKPLFILALGGSAIDIGMVLVARTLPAVVFGLLAGVIADNFNRRLVLLITKVIVFGLSILFTALIIVGWIELWHIYAYNILRGMTMAFDQPARRAMIPTIVPANLITNAMALSTGSMTAMRIAGAAAAGILVATSGFGVTYAVMTGIYVLAIFFTWMLRPADHERSGYQGVKSMGNDFMEGLKYAWRVPDIRGILIISLGWFTFGMAFMQVFAPLFAVDVLKVDAEGTGFLDGFVRLIAGTGGEGVEEGAEGSRLFGAMLSVAAVGSTIGALVLAKTNPTKHRGLIMLALLFAFGLLLITFSASTYAQSVPLALLVLLFLGVGQSGFFPLINAVLVEKAHETMRGRVLGVLSLDRAMTTAGGAAAGFMAAGLGPQMAQILFGVGLVITAMAMFSFYPPLRRID